MWLHYCVDLRKIPVTNLFDVIVIQIFRQLLNASWLRNRGRQGMQ